MTRICLAIAIGIVVCCISTFFASAQQSTGQWRVDDNDGDTQVSFFDKGNTNPDTSPLLMVSCDHLNEVIAGVYRTSASAAVAAARSGQLLLQLTGERTKFVIPTYGTQAPGEEAVGFETPFTAGLASVLGAQDLVIEVDDTRISVDAKGVEAFSKLTSSCPEAPTMSAGDMNQYRTHVRAMDGVSVDIPTRVFRLVNADRNGRSYRTEAGDATLTILAFNNALDQSINDGYTRALADRAIVAAPSYKAKGKDFFVISGKTRNQIIYYKSVLTCDASKWVSLRLAYNEARKPLFDSMVKRVSQSFTPRLAADGTALCE